MQLQENFQTTTGSRQTKNNDYFRHQFCTEQIGFLQGQNRQLSLECRNLMACITLKPIKSELVMRKHVHLFCFESQSGVKDNCNFVKF